MSTKEPPIAAAPPRRAASLEAARMQLRAPQAAAPSLWPALGAAFLAACAGLATAAAVILGGAGFEGATPIVKAPPDRTASG